MTYIPPPPPMLLMMPMAPMSPPPMQPVMAPMFPQPTIELMSAFTQLIPTRAMLNPGSPHSRVGRMKRTLIDHYGSLRRTPVPLLALVHYHDKFRLNNTALRKALREQGQPGFYGLHLFKALRERSQPRFYGLNPFEDSAERLIGSRFSSNVTLMVQALYKFKDILETLRKPVGPFQFFY